MHTSQRTPRRLAVLATLGAASLLLTACGSSDPLADAPETSGGERQLVVGSQDYYSNEIVAELYAQALEDGGFAVERQFRIGQREIYMPEIEAGKIDVFPEYTGNLLQYLDADTSATTSDDVYSALQGALPEGLRVLDQAEASDQDTYVVTREFADEHDLQSIGDLAGIEKLTLGGNSELEKRPYGPKGLEQVYGVRVGFTPVEDSGGPLTVKALRDGQVQLVDLYSADPVFAEGDLVKLEDPKGLFLASQVVPVVSDRVDEKAAQIIDAVSGELSAEDLVALGSQSVNDEAPAKKIAKAWLEEHRLIG